MTKGYHLLRHDESRKSALRKARISMLMRTRLPCASPPSVPWTWCPGRTGC